MILTKDEAKAVYDAMCDLNNVGGRLIAIIGSDEFGAKRVFEKEDGSIRVVIVIEYVVDKSEEYEHQPAFAKAYRVK